MSTIAAFFTGMVTGAVFGMMTLAVVLAGSDQEQKGQEDEK